VSVEVRFLGTGDAFGSGGRFHTCIQVTVQGRQFLVDCGASATVAIHRYGLDPAAIDAIVLSHLHGDHFGGVPFFILDAHFAARRTRPLVIAGPPGTPARIWQALDALFPGSSAMTLRYPLRIAEMSLERPHRLDAATVTPYAVQHPSGAPSTALRIECHGRTIAYSGDTEWTDTLIAVARGADLFIMECNAYDRKIPYHMDLPTLMAHRDQLRARRLVITHMGPEMLAHLGELPCECAGDGMAITL
jgi:ribonuclease BN (tRNA processing enzyme)